MWPLLVSVHQPRSCDDIAAAGHPHKPTLVIMKLQKKNKQTIEMDIFTVEFGNFRYMLWACIMQFHFSPWLVLSKSKCCCQSTIFAPFQLWDEGPQINQKQHFDWALFQSVDITTVVRGPVVKQSKQWRQCWSNDQSDSFYSVIRILLQKRTSWSPRPSSAS